MVGLMGGLVANEDVHWIEHRSFDFVIKMGLWCTSSLAISPPHYISCDFQIFDARSI